MYVVKIGNLEKFIPKCMDVLPLFPVFDPFTFVVFYQLFSGNPEVGLKYIFGKSIFP